MRRLTLLVALVVLAARAANNPLGTPPERGAARAPLPATPPVRVEPPAPPPAAVATPGPTDAQVVIETLLVKGRAPKTGYSRQEFGPAWSDADRNGCDTRNDILQRDLTQITLKPGTKNCVVLQGLLLDPYSGQTIVFQQGQGTSSLVQIDHVVSLSNAWQTGMFQRPPAERLQFANDPFNLFP